MTDNDWLERKFRARPNEWLRMTDLLGWSEQERGHGLTVHSRVADLRARGLVIEQQGVREWNGFSKSYSGRVTSYYRFVPLVAADLAPPGDGSAATNRTGEGGVAEPHGRADRPAPVAPIDSGASATPQQAALFDLPKKAAWA